MFLPVIFANQKSRIDTHRQRSKEIYRNARESHQKRVEKNK